jgi:hypothetical protein
VCTGARRGFHGFVLGTWKRKEGLRDSPPAILVISASPIPQYSPVRTVLHLIGFLSQTCLPTSSTIQSTPRKSLLEAGQALSRAWPGHTSTPHPNQPLLTSEIHALVRQRVATTNRKRRHRLSHLFSFLRQHTSFLCSLTSITSPSSIPFDRCCMLGLIRQGCTSHPRYLATLPHFA